MKTAAFKKKEEEDSEHHSHDLDKYGPTSRAKDDKDFDVVDSESFNKSNDRQSGPRLQAHHDHDYSSDTSEPSQKKEEDSDEEDEESSDESEFSR